MEKDFGCWFRHQLSNRQSPNLYANLGRQNTLPACMSPFSTAVPANGTLPGFGFSSAPHSKASQLNEPHGWFYCLPRFRQAFTPTPNALFKEKTPTGAGVNHEETVTCNAELGCAQKRFLVFDQSGDKTTFMFSPGMGTPFQCPTSRGPKPGPAYHLNKMETGTERATIQRPEPILTDEFGEHNRDDMESEMHEDTEELNALLYSDDDDYSEDDEVASTGHSPSTMTDIGKPEWIEESEDEVASSAGPNKRLKLFDGGHVSPSLPDTANFVKPERCFDYEDDAESSCADRQNQGLGEFGSLSGNKRSRKDKIRETVTILRRILPGGNVNDPIGILDEAISYLRSLKDKAEALGVDAL